MMQFVLTAWPLVANRDNAQIGNGINRYRHWDADGVGFCYIPEVT